MRDPQTTLRRFAWVPAWLGLAALTLAACGRSDLLLDDGRALDGGGIGRAATGASSGGSGASSGASSGPSGASSGSANPGRGSHSEAGSDPGSGHQFFEDDGSTDDGDIFTDNGDSGDDGTSNPSGTDAAPASGCGPTNCAGCCVNGFCQNGTFRSFCGFGGVACIMCGPEQTCSVNGACD